MKDTYYFSHDYNAREDEKIKDLIFKHDWFGYGLYWAIIEQLYSNNGYMQINYKRIAHDLRTSEETIKSIIEEFNLFIFADGTFTSCSVLRRLNKQKSLSQKRAKAAETKWKKHYANAEQMHSNCNAINESKVNESKVNESKEEVEEEKNIQTQATAEEKKQIENIYSSLKLNEELLKPEILTILRAYPSTNLQNVALKVFARYPHSPPWQRFSAFLTWAGNEFPQEKIKKRKIQGCPVPDELPDVPELTQEEMQIRKDFIKKQREEIAAKFNWPNLVKT